MRHAYQPTYLFCLAAAALSLSGCTSFSDYVHHGFKVGPEYGPPKAAVAPQWVDSTDIRVRSHAADLSRWWCVFNDPVLNDLVYRSYNQNINLKEYGTRILQARYNLAIQKGELFPQTQNASGNYQRTAAPATELLPGFPKFYDQWNLGFNLAWELDFWGQFRRAVLAAQAQLDASVENYDAVLVTLLSDVSQYYMQMRQYQEQIELAKHNVKLQRDVLNIVQARFNVGTASELDVDQQQTTLSQTEASIPALEIQLRQSQDQLCTLLGIPPTDLQTRLGQRPIPTAPSDVVVGIPAQLLERRPDIRSAERACAAQAQQIGIAEAALYPHISITGSLGYSALNASQLFTPQTFEGSVGPSFQWNILNYGRLANNVRLQDAKFQQTLLDYRTVVLTANQEAEDGLVAFLRSQEQAKMLAEGVIAADKAFRIVVAQYRVGTVDFNRLAIIETNLVTAQVSQAQARAAIALGLVQVYRSLGGGWEIRLGQGSASGLPQPGPLPAGADSAPLPEPRLNPAVDPANEPVAPLPPPRAKQN
jgi:NodT family efflux transporter outer membrane factor (OMF) lipoprotein